MNAKRNRSPGAICAAIRPIAAEVTVEPLEGENVRPQVRFGGGPVPPSFKLQTDREPVTLRDDGREGIKCSAIAN